MCDRRNKTNFVFESDIKSSSFEQNNAHFPVNSLSNSKTEVIKAFIEIKFTFIHDSTFD